MNINGRPSGTFLLDTGGERLISEDFEALAENKLEIIRKRLIAGLESAKLARHLKGEVERSMKKICSMLRVGRSALYEYLDEDNYQNIG